MTTFTMQDLTPEQQVALTKHEEMHKMFQQMGGDLTGGKTALFDDTSAPEVPTETKEVIQNIMQTFHAPEPQATPIATPVANIDDIINTICAQLQLLSTVIRGERAQGNSLNAGENSLQECVSLTLQQADWFKEMVKEHLKDMGVDDIAESVAENLVEREVEHYFDNRFDPSDHFDMDDAMSNAVSDQLDDVVRDRLDDVVQEQFDAFMENVTIKLER